MEDRKKNTRHMPGKRSLDVPGESVKIVVHTPLQLCHMYGSVFGAAYELRSAPEWRDKEGEEDSLLQDAPQWPPSWLSGWRIASWVQDWQTPSWVQNWQTPLWLQDWQLPSWVPRCPGIDELGLPPAWVVALDALPPVTWRTKVLVPTAAVLFLILILVHDGTGVVDDDPDEDPWITHFRVCPGLCLAGPLQSRGFALPSNHSQVFYAHCFAGASGTKFATRWERTCLVLHG